MPISHDHKIIFVHIPKTGGTSIEYAFGMHGKINYIGQKPYLNQKENLNTFFGKKIQHYSLSEIRDRLCQCNFTDYTHWSLYKKIIDKLYHKNLFITNIKLFKNNRLKNYQHYKQYYKFTVIRNPYERIVSFFAWQDQNWTSKTVLSMSQFNEKLKNFINNSEKFKPQYKPQYKYLYDSRKLMVDEILRFENLEDEFNKMCGKLKIDVKLPHRMKSNHELYEYYYTNETKNIIYELYKDDFELFKYKK